MFVKIVKNVITKELSSLDEMRKQFPHISFPDEIDETVKLPVSWFLKDSKAAKEKLGE